jgi:hypothetical protein
MPRTTTQTPRKPAKASGGESGTKTPQRASTARQRGRSKATGNAKPNPFDAIAQASAKGDDDLARQLAASMGQAKGQRKGAGTRVSDQELTARLEAEAKRARGGSPRSNSKADPKPKGRPASTFAGRPTSNPDTIAARAKEAGIRVRKDSDPADIATRLRATVEATAAWLASRNGSPVKATAKTTAKQPAKTTAKATTAKAKAKPPKPTPPPHIDVTHAWEGAVPKGMPELRGASLIMRYELRPNGEVWSALWGILDPDGNRMQDGWQLPLDFRWNPERDGRNRVIRLKGPTLDKSTLTAWLATQGLITE